MSDGYVLDDARAMAAEAPYTFFRPCEDRLAAVAPGDLVKLIFHAVPPSSKWGGERMWVLVTETDGQIMSGTLDNSPQDIPLLKSGDVVRFAPHHIISIEFKNSAVEPKCADRREFWERCLVDRCVLDDEVPVGFIYREPPETALEGKYPDSGWRIRGDARGVAVEEVDARECTYVAIGAVLNRDDSWLSLIDEPVGSRFLRNFATDMYEAQTE